MFCFIFSLNDSRLPMKQAKPCHMPNNTAVKPGKFCAAARLRRRRLSRRAGFSQHQGVKDNLAQTLPGRLIWPEPTAGQRQQWMLRDVRWCQLR